MMISTDPRFGGSPTTGDGFVLRRNGQDRTPITNREAYHMLCDILRKKWVARVMEQERERA